MTNPYRPAILTEAAIAGGGDGTLFVAGDGTMKAGGGGATGATGPAGPTGATGATGATGSSGLLTRTVTLTSAQLKALHSNPAILVPAPGTGLVVIPLMFIAQYDFGTTPYVSSDNAETVTYANGVSQNYDIYANAPSLAAGFTGDTSYGPFYGPADLSNINGAPLLGAIDDQALVFGEPSADATGGDGTMTWSIAYYVMSVPS